MVAGRLGSHSEADVREAMEWLAAEGHIYQTIDEEHYKTTDQ